MAEAKSDFVALELSSPQKMLARTSSATGSARVAMEVSGMTCASCAGKVEKSLMAVSGVESAVVSLVLGKVDVVFDAEAADPAQLAHAVSGAGFSATVLGAGPEEDSAERVARLAVSGMTCVSCSSTVERGLVGLAGVVEATVNLSMALATVKYRPGLVGPRDLVEHVEALGFEATVEARSGPGAGPSAEALSNRQRRETRLWRGRFLLALVLTLPVSLISMVLMNIPSIKMALMARLGDSFFTYDALIMWVLATPVQFYSGAPFYKSCYAELRRCSLGMSSLIVFGTSVAYLYSAVMVTITAVDPSLENLKAAHFFETAAMLITFVLLGKWLESRAKGKTSEALTKLMEMQARTATLLKFEDATDPARVTGEREVSMELLQRGDVIKVLPGGKIPADGVIVFGRASVDESMITGESVPVSKKVGDKVIGATTSFDGMLHVRVAATGADSMLAQICSLIEQAQTCKAPIQAYADKISAVFVPCIVVISLVTFFAWLGITHSGIVPLQWYPDGFGPVGLSTCFAVSVLVIACPCALGLATPTAVMVGTGVAATNGVLIKGGDIIQIASKVTTVVFDKTGTLTTGKARVHGLVVLPAWRKSRGARDAQASTSAASSRAAGQEAAPGLVVLSIEGMMCMANCGSVVQATLRDVESVASANVDFDTHTATVVFKDASKAGSDAAVAELVDAVESVGFGAELKAEGNSSAAFNTASAVPGAATEAEARAELVFLLGSAESGSEHPLGRAVVAHAEQQLASAAGSGAKGEGKVGEGDGKGPAMLGTPLDLRVLPGRGIACFVAGRLGGGAMREVLIGNRELMAEEGAVSSGLDQDKSTEAEMRRVEDGGHTAVLVAIDKRIVAVLDIADTLKQDAAGTIKALQQLGKDVWMVTGDNRRTAEAVAAEVGIPPDRVMAQVLPADKAGKVLRLQQAQHDGGDAAATATRATKKRRLRAIVAMVGDGINDSPALAQADVGIAIGAGTEVAIETADMVLVKSHLRDVLTALHLSRRIFDRIRLNLFFSLAYNTVCIPVAAGLLFPVTQIMLPPMVAGAAMAASSVSVVTSSLLLRMYKPPSLKDAVGGGKTIVPSAAQSSRKSRRAGSDEGLATLLITNIHDGCNMAHNMECNCHPDKCICALCTKHNIARNIQRRVEEMRLAAGVRSQPSSAYKPPVLVSHVGLPLAPST